MPKFYGEEVPDFFADFCIKVSKKFTDHKERPENGPHIYLISEEEYDKLDSALPSAARFCSRVVAQEHFLIGNFEIAVVRGANVYRP
jgi:hypothetical protein